MAAPDVAPEPEGNWRHVRPRTALVLVLFHATFTALWLTFYGTIPLIPARWRPLVDTITLPRAESWLFGRYVGSLWRKPLPLLLFAAIPYVLHFAVPLLFLLYAVMASRRRPEPRARPFSFVGALVWGSFLMHLTQVLLPMAPPWYNRRSGHSLASYDMRGDPGDLQRLDAAFNMTFFDGMYLANPIVFGSFPSGHVMWPLLVLLHQWTVKGRLLSLLHVMWVAWSALFLTHHFLVDILGAYAYTLIGIWLARLMWLVIGLVVGGRYGLLGNSSNNDALASGVAKRRAWQAVIALLFGFGARPWAAPDIEVASMSPETRCEWAPDLGDETSPDVAAALNSSSRSVAHEA